MTPRILPSLGAALAVALAATGARATTSCSFTTVVGVSFGSYNMLATSPLDSTGSFTFNCAGVGGTDTITINLGHGAAPSYWPRQMVRGAVSLAYNLFVNAARTQVWGDGTSSTYHYGPVTPPNGADVTVPIYGRVPAGQIVTAGTYGDTIVITILF